MLAGNVFLFGKKNIVLSTLNQRRKQINHLSLFYIPNPVVVSIGCEAISVDGGIKSLDPPCLGFAYSGGQHPFTCSYCHKQLRELNNLSAKRKNATS